MAKSSNTVDKVIKIAKAEVGYLEKASNKDLDSKTKNAGYNNYTKYGRDMHKLCPSVMDFPAPWCDCFVDWCFYKAYGKTNALALIGGAFDDYTVASAQLYKDKKAWYKTPKKGDQIFFNDDKGGICHTGLVYKVDDTYVYTIEGNTSSVPGVVANGGCVAYKQYTKTYSKIAGYGRPKYDKSSSSDDKNKVPKLASCNPNIAYGSKGTQVKYLQQDLNFVLGVKLDVDGIAGNKTVNALKKFQGMYNLTVDGIYGSASKKAMESALDQAS